MYNLNRWYEKEEVSLVVEKSQIRQNSNKRKERISKWKQRKWIFIGS